MAQMTELNQSTAPVSTPLVDTLHIHVSYVCVKRQFRNSWKWRHERLRPSIPNTASTTIYRVRILGRRASLMPTSPTSGNSTPLQLHTLGGVWCFDYIKFSLFLKPTYRYLPRAHKVSGCVWDIIASNNMWVFKITGIWRRTTDNNLHRSPLW